MHAFPIHTIEGLDKMEAKEQAELSAYRDPQTKQLYIPGLNIQRALVSAASYSKGKGRSSLSRTVAATFLINPERILLGLKTYEVDSRPVVVPATKGRVMRHRPKLDKWKIKFILEYDPVLLSAIQVRRIVDDMGSKVGLLDFRPEKKGPFGRCQITNWKEL